MSTPTPTELAEAVDRLQDLADEQPSADDARALRMVLVEYHRRGAVIEQLSAAEVVTEWRTTGVPAVREKRQVHRWTGPWIAAGDPAPPAEACPLHSWQFDGDDPYVICMTCDEMRDAITGRVIRPGQPASPAVLCRSCGRPESPTHDADAPGPTSRHTFTPQPGAAW